MNKEKSLKKAIKALKARTTAMAVVYGYSRGRVFHDDCIVVYNILELKEFQRLLSSKKSHKTDTIVYTLFRNQLPE